MDKKLIGPRIRDLRTEKEWSQLELASLLKIHRSTLSKIETGDILPTTRILVELKRIFSISIDKLLANPGTMEPGESVETEVRELLTALREQPGVKHAVLSFFYQYKASHPEFFIHRDTYQSNSLNRG
jgi:transcriptional regulator with XRE-family HTH domain